MFPLFSHYRVKLGFYDLWHSLLKWTCPGRFGPFVIASSYFGLMLKMRCKSRASWGCAKKAYETFSWCLSTSGEQVTKFKVSPRQERPLNAHFNLGSLNNSSLPKVSLVLRSSAVLNFGFQALTKATYWAKSSAKTGGPSIQHCTGSFLPSLAFKVTPLLFRAITIDSFLLCQCGPA